MEKEKMEKRASGILLHITSLPSDIGWGTFSNSAYEFIDFLRDGGFGVWQVLPFSETNFSQSPYSAVSSFAINPRFLNLKEFLSNDELNNLGFYNVSDINDYVTKFDNALMYLKTKFESIVNDIVKYTSAKTKVSKSVYLGNANFKIDIMEYIQFEKNESFWLEDYALYKAIKVSQNNKSWVDWSNGLKNRNKLELEKFRKEHLLDIIFTKFIQFLLFNQWCKIKKYASDNGVKIFGDMPYYVELDSADVWANPSNFKLENGKPKLVAGVPPDYFNEMGQLWGNPIYDFNYMKKNNYDFWVKRVKRQSELFDILRIDHFIAFAKYYAIPASSKSAQNGKWVKGAGKDLLKNILKCKIDIVAEDLGILTDEVISLKNEFKIPGVKVMQFGFDGVGDNMYQPHNYEKNCVAYLGTHDNNTMMGMLNEGNWDKINRFKKYFNMPLQEGNDKVIDNSILSLYASHAGLIILTVQDILHLGSEARMNIPGVPDGNWTWKLSSAMDRNMCVRFRDLAYTYARI